MCSKMRPVRLLVADGHRVVRAGIKSWLAEMGSARPFEVEEARDTEEAIDKVFSAQFDLVLLEYALPGRGGLKVVEIIRARRPDLPVLGWAYTDERQPAEQMMRAGAMGYLLTNAEREVLLTAIWTVLSGQRYYSNEVAVQLIDRAPVAERDRLETLTRREKMVFRLVIEGLTDREIGERFGICKKTVDNYRANLMAKLGVRNTVQLVRVAIEIGWVVRGN
jgi:DNA-binding NarL/FixJ family response regulator